MERRNEGIRREDGKRRHIDTKYIYMYLYTPGNAFVLLHIKKEEQRLVRVLVDKSR